MSNKMKVTGMVLSVMDIGDYDKRLVILTKDRGKINVFAKGARRPKSQLLAPSQPFTFGEFNIYIGRNSNSLNSVEVSNYFSGLRKSLESVYYGIYFCEFTDYVSHENNDGREMLQLLYMSLIALEKNVIEYELIQRVFELKAISLEGQAPQVFECVKCGTSEDIKKFSVELGGLLCLSCTKHDTYGMVLRETTIYTMQYIISQDIKELFKFRLKEEVLYELGICIERYRQRYIPYNFKTLDLIKTL